ncbi:helix-turn-helix domain-containing protein [Variovorax robiniae]|uniref:Helix-turn-helix domain-containing protein n=1 Tax=Variovorax robiniae TaxID=1836199 RepID=A0ABU8XEG6_9BURK
MANIAALLKSEIARVARKEVRAEIESLKKASAQQRGAIAQLKREVAHLQKDLRLTRTRAGAAVALSPAAPAAHQPSKRRFSAARLAAHRAKLGLSAAAYGQLVGMSGATIYNWEQGKSRPDGQQLSRLAALRAMPRSSLVALANP